MARPEQGKVIDPSIPADISDCSLEDACNAVQSEGIIPRVLNYSIDDYTRYGKEIDDLAWKYGITSLLESTYEDGEWAVHDLKEGDDRTTYWNSPP